MKEVCIECLKTKGFMCVDAPVGRVMTHLPDMKYEVVGKAVSSCPLKAKPEEAEETMEDVNRWFELEGKTDTLHLGS